MPRLYNHASLIKKYTAILESKGFKECSFDFEYEDDIHHQLVIEVSQGSSDSTYEPRSVSGRVSEFPGSCGMAITHDVVGYSLELTKIYFQFLVEFLKGSYGALIHTDVTNNTPSSWSVQAATSVGFRKWRGDFFNPNSRNTIGMWYKDISGKAPKRNVK